MATLALTVAASSFASSIGASALTTSLLGAAATVAGTVIDNALFGGGKDSQSFVEGPRLDALEVSTSQEGNPIKRVYGRVRIAGDIIWATRLEERIVTTSETQSTGGKGGITQQSSQTVTTTQYLYFANIAIGICEGKVGYLNRMWADGKEVDLASVTYRFYRGTNSQNPDSLIESVEGVGRAPGYRGLCYIVFEDLPLERYGNRIPQFTFEIVRPSPVQTVEENTPPELPAPQVRVEEYVEGVNLIPGSTEFGYNPTKIEKVITSSSGAVTGREPENTNSKSGKTDWDVSIDQMEIVMPNLKSVCLVVAWFFDDLRCGSCELMPRVENDDKKTTPDEWRVAGLNRSTATVVSYLGTPPDDYPAYGGSPNDASVVRAIKDLRARGYEVMLYPFLMGDIPPGNGLPDPYGSSEQAALPWRGRITCHPAPGQPASPDKSSVAAAQVASFVGTCTPADFSSSGEEITYTGPNEWSYRRFILHMAHLAKLAGGVESMCIGSEMAALTTVRSDTATYPFVDALVNLTSDVRTIVGSSVKLGYAADWSEYHSHRPDDGSGDVLYNLDPVWTDPEIDFIGIDNYLPLSDWRDGSNHLDYNINLDHTSPYELDYLKSNVEGGEYYDWYYASYADRENQVRTPISSWVYRQKDIRGWWENQHVQRPGGVAGQATEWAPRSKPIWFTEVGCPSLDKGANQPNVFYDRKSSESALPYFSNGSRDDVISRRYVQAMTEYWDPSEGNNPVSPVYGGNMIRHNRIHVWSWDARPFPSWPLDSASWADSENWQYGHWLSARMGSVYVPDLLAHIASDYGFDKGYFERAYGSCDGYIIDRTLSFRDAVGPLGTAFLFDLIETGGGVRAVTRLSTPVRAVLTLDSLAQGDEEPVTLTRGQATEIPRALRLKFLDSERAYTTSAVQSVRGSAASTGISEVNLPVVIDEDRAQAAADLWLADTWASREAGQFSLLPSALALEVGDAVTLSVGDLKRDLRMTQIVESDARRSNAVSYLDAQLSSAPVSRSPRPLPPVNTVSLPLVRFLDVPLLRDNADPSAGYIAASATPWPGGVSVYRSASADNWQLNSALAQSAIIGETLSGLAPGPTGIFDRGNHVDVELYAGGLESVDDLALFSGRNGFAIQGPDGEWEILQAGKVDLLGTRTYRLSRLLRGQLGSEHVMAADYPVGAPLVAITGAVSQVSMGINDLGLEYQWRYGPQSEPIGSELFSTEAFTYNGVALRPYAPAHTRAIPQSNGDFAVTWIRRTRTGGDSWNIAEIPVGEDVEKYAIDVLDSSGVVVRSEETAIPAFTYTAAMRNDDLGAAATFSFRVCQVSPVYGRGTYSRTDVSI